MRLRTDTRTGARGFTLTELLVVIAIITILATITIPNLIGYIEKGRVAGTLSDVKNADTSLRGMLSDAGVNRFQDFLSPGARYVLDNFENDPADPRQPGMPEPHPVTDLDHEEHLELLYRTMFYTLLRVGRDAALEENLEGDGTPGTPPYGLRELFSNLPNAVDPNVNQAFGDPYYFGPDNDPDQEDSVFDRAVVNKLRSSYMDLGTDSWNNQYHFWMGPLDRGTPAEPVPLRSFRLNEDAITTPYVWNAAARDAEKQKVAGQPPADNAGGYPAPIDFPVYIWSNGPNEESDAHIGLRTSNDPGFAGGGDDINNWDPQAGWQNAPVPTS